VGERASAAEAELVHPDQDGEHWGFDRITGLRCHQEPEARRVADPWRREAARVVREPRECSTAEPCGRDQRRTGARTPEPITRSRNRRVARGHNGHAQRSLAFARHRTPDADSALRSRLTNGRELMRTLADPCHAEGRGFESHHPLTGTRWKRRVSPWVSSCDAPEWRTDRPGVFVTAPHLTSKLAGSTSSSLPSNELEETF
jgi:hypothetical protein